MKTIELTSMMRKNFDQEAERRSFDKGYVDLVTVGDITFGRVTLMPGWRWSDCVKPVVNTERCEMAHLQYIMSGRMHIVTQDGDEMDFGPGDIAFIPPGHEGWVVGDEPVVGIDMVGMTEYAKSK